MEIAAGYQIRKADVRDAAVIGHQRRAMFEEIGMSGDMPAMEAGFTEWVIPYLEDGHYLGWLVIDEAGKVVAGAGVRMIEWAPTPATPEKHYRPYILNVYVEPPHRKKGLARTLLEVILEWAQAINVPVLSLHASSYGRPLYEQLGFTDTNEMRFDF